MMLASNYKHRAKFFKKEITVDELLQEIEEIVEYGSFWCAIYTLTGKDVQAVATEYKKDTFRLVMRYNPAITSDMSVEINGKQYEITDLINDGLKNETLTLILTNNLKA